MISRRDRILLESKIDRILNEITSDDVNTAIAHKGHSGKMTSKDLEDIVNDLIDKELGKNGEDVDLEDDESNENPRQHKEKESSKVSMKQKTDDVLQWLNKPETDNAAIMRDVWHPQDDDEEDAFRSLWTKKKNHKKNDNGSVYNFSDHDINKIYSIKGSLQ